MPFQFANIQILFHISAKTCGLAEKLRKTRKESAVLFYRMAVLLHQKTGIKRFSTSDEEIKQLRQKMSKMKGEKMNITQSCDVGGRRNVRPDRKDRIAAKLFYGGIVAVIIAIDLLAIILTK